MAFGNGFLPGFCRVGRSQTRLYLPVDGFWRVRYPRPHLKQPRIGQEANTDIDSNNKRLWT